MARSNFHLPVLGIIKNKNGKVLLIQRNNPESPHSHLKWAFPGGGIEFGEHPNQTLIREVKGEVGVEIDPLEEFLFIENHIFEEDKIQVLCLCYPARHKHGKIDISHDEGIKDAQWFDEKSIDYSTCLPKTKEILEKALKHL